VADYVVEFGKDGRPVEPDGRLDAPAFHRNHAPIWAVLQPFLAGKSGDVLEAGSGTGQHVLHFARHAPDIIWWPSDTNEAHLKYFARFGVKNICGYPTIADGRLYATVEELTKMKDLAEKNGIAIDWTTPTLHFRFTNFLDVICH